MKTTLVILIASCAFAQAEPASSAQSYYETLDPFHQVVARNAAANPLAYIGTDYGCYGNGRYDPARQPQPSIAERQEAEKRREIADLQAKMKKEIDQLEFQQQQDAIALQQQLNSIRLQQR